MGAPTKICLTGGAGYISSIIQHYAYQDPNYVLKICSTKNSTKYQNIDWGNIQSLEKCVMGADVVIHAAGLNQSDCNSNPGNVRNVNVLNTLNLFQACQRSLVKKFIFLSTVHVYGNSYNGLLSEETFPSPLGLYAQSKFEAEQELTLSANGTDLQLLILRLGNVFGFRKSFDNYGLDLVVNEFIYGALMERTIKIKGNPNTTRPFISGEFFSEILFRLINMNFCNPTIINVVGEANYKLIEVAEVVKMIMANKYKKNIAVDVLSKDSTYPYENKFLGEYVKKLNLKCKNSIETEILNTLASFME